jgi:hypothetical protein
VGAITGTADVDIVGLEAPTVELGGCDDVSDADEDAGTGVNWAAGPLLVLDEKTWKGPNPTNPRTNPTNPRTVAAAAATKSHSFRDDILSSPLVALAGIDLDPESPGI